MLGRKVTLSLSSSLSKCIVRLPPMLLAQDCSWPARRTGEQHGWVNPTTAIVPLSILFPLQWHIFHKYEPVSYTHLTLPTNREV